MMDITIETTVNAPVEKVWAAWVTPSDITQWNFASDDWTCPKATIDLREGQRFSYRMEAKDGTTGFDFEGTFTAVEGNKRIEYALDDNRKVSVEFAESNDGVRVTETFDAEDTFSGEQQRQGWQSILNNFKKHVEANCDKQAAGGDAAR